MLSDASVGELVTVMTVLSEQIHTRGKITKGNTTLRQTCEATKSWLTPDRPTATATTTLGMMEMARVMIRRTMGCEGGLSISLSNAKSNVAQIHACLPFDEALANDHTSQCRRDRCTLSGLAKARLWSQIRIGSGAAESFYYTHTK